MLDIQLPSKKASLWPDAKTRPLTAGNIILTSFSEAPPEFQKGDVSMDGQITAHDAQLIMKYVVGQIKLTPEQLELADVSGNGRVSAYDAGMVMQKITGLTK
ncbi:MAG: dockerin type I repeat-containing protein, partial [bacterium]